MSVPFSGAVRGGGQAGGRAMGLRRGLSALALATFVLTATFPARAQAEEPEAVVLELDADALGALAAGRIEPDLRDPMIASLKARGFRIVPAGSADLVIRTRIAFHDSQDRDYTVHIDLIQAGGEPEPLVEWLLCSTCSESALVRRTLAKFDEATLALHEQLTPPPDLRPPTPPKPRPEAAAPIAGLGQAGVGVAVSGLLVTGTGLGLYFTRDAPIKTEDKVEPTHLYAPAAEILMAVGSTTLGLGLSALIMDLVARRQRNAPPVQTALSWSSESFSLSVAFAL